MKTPETKKTKKQKIDIDALDLKFAVATPEKIAAMSAPTLKTKYAVKLAEQILKDVRHGVSVFGPKDWPQKKEIRTTLMRDLKIIAKPKLFSVKCAEKGSELCFYFKKIEPKKEKPAETQAAYI